MMTASVPTVLKKHAVRLVDCPPMSAAAPKGPTPNGAATARIIEQGPQEALLEVVCPCGETIHVRCQYQGDTQ